MFLKIYEQYNIDLINFCFCFYSCPSRGDTSIGSFHIAGWRSKQHRPGIGVSTAHRDGCMLAKCVIGFLHHIEGHRDSTDRPSGLRYWYL